MKPVGLTPPVLPQRAAMAPGQQAKAAVAAARDQGADLPKNAQGIAASSIARGADPATLFAALVTPEPAPEPAPEAPPEAAADPLPPPENEEAAA